MTTITINLDDDVARRVEESARREQKSVVQWVTDRLLSEASLAQAPTSSEDDPFASVTLPTGLARRDDGAITIEGHRVHLYQVISRYSQGRTLDDLSSDFQTLPKWKIALALEFIDGHRAECQRYLEQCEQAGRKAERTAAPLRHSL